MSKYDKWYIIRKLLCSTFRISKKMQICKNYRKIQLYSKMFAKIFFEKPLTMPFQICKNFCKILNNLIFNQEKLKMCKFPLRGCLQKNFFAKLVQFVFLCQRLSKKLNLIKIWQVEVGENKALVCYRKNQSFRQLELKPGFRPKGRAVGM